MKTRVVMVAGPGGSGKTSLVKAVSGKIGEFAFMANNVESMDEMEGLCVACDAFPARTPCARPRQFRIRLGHLLEGCDVPLVVAEPPGMCSETCAPILNQVHVFDSEEYALGPLILVLNPENAGTLWGNDAAGQKCRLCVDEADLVVISKSEGIPEGERDRLRGKILSLNDGCRVVFFSAADGEGIDAVVDAVLNGKYLRPLNG